MTPPAEFMLAQYRHFELGKFSDDMNGHVPSELFSLLPMQFSKELADRGIPNGAGKTLLIRGKVVYYEDASTLGAVLGPFEEAVARVEFVEKDSGKTLADCYCVGRTKSLRQRGVRGKAEPGQGRHELDRQTLSKTAENQGQQGRLAGNGIIEACLGERK